ncbi:MAG: hypothetical protein LBE92_17115 [Chryseobacterium sp.]|jgi:hypothetical protein|uniref:hypothetical protein n=1 Tax=Chryseobacterium sp. TaxID=1871047 RepID=UPI00281ABB08|nr:hypothetical protein [Chryseobacterium sp.]MDR2237846.1 hypothetical protein [Chryseobacterium sp.]
MKTTLPILILLFFIQFYKSQEKQINVKYENIEINIPGKPGPWLMHNQSFYCYYSTDYDSYSSTSKNSFYVLDKKGKIKSKIEVPKELLQTSYYDLYMRNDSIFTTEYDDQNTFFLDENNQKWIRTKKRIDLIYHDHSYEVFSKDFGPWGGVTWFKDKKTKKQYEFAGSNPVINYFNNIYYATLNHRILKISNPKAMQLNEPYDYEKPILAKDYFRNGSHSLTGTKTIFEDKNNDYKTYFSIATSFIANKKLYSIYTDNMSSKIGILDHHKLIPIYEFEEKIKPFVWNYTWRNLISNNHYQTFQFSNEKTKQLGILEIDCNNIHVFNFTNSYKEPVFGEQKLQEIVEKAINYYIDNFNHLNLSPIDSIEQSDNATDVTQSHKMTHYLLKCRDVETPRIYRKFETPQIKLLSAYYYTSKEKRIELINLEWKTKTNFESMEEAIEELKFNPLHSYKSKFSKLSIFLINKIGEPSKRSVDKDRSRLQWESSTKSIELYYDKDIVKLSILRK